MTKVQKGMRGTWEAKDSIELGNDRVLQVSTHKTSDGSLVTTATVHLRDGQFLSHRMFTDFSQRLAARMLRCTEKNVTLQHADAMRLRELTALKEAITAWYVAKGECVA